MATEPTERIFVAGHLGLVGSALVRRLAAAGVDTLLTRTRSELDLENQAAVEQFFSTHKPDQVYVAAARVGGILANSSRPAEFIYSNLVVQTNLIHSAWRNGVRKLCFLGSSCIYPKAAAQPINEDALLQGPLEPTNEPYAIAKIAGIKLCQAYRKQYGFDSISLMPTNLYGPGDNFDADTAHVLPALMRRFHDAKLRGDQAVAIWGTGTPRREFLHVDDLADAAVHLMDTYACGEIINVGAGSDITISDLAARVAAVVGYEGRIEMDTSKPDGTPRKLLDCGRLAELGWRPRIGLDEGIRSTYAWFVAHQGEYRR